MRRGLAVLAVTVALAGTACGDDGSDSASTTTTTVAGTTTTAAEALSAESLIHARGVGPVLAGMTVKEAQEAAGVALELSDDEVDAFDGFCYHARADTVPGIAFMVTNESRPADPRDGRIGRVSVYGSSDDPAEVAAAQRFRTEAGIHVGSTEAEVLAAYPDRIRTENHKYVPTGHYLWVEAAGEEDKELAIRFATDGKVVDEIHAGAVEQVGYIEGCA